MKLVSIENYPGKEFEVLGIVKGTIQNHIVTHGAIEMMCSTQKP